MFLAQLIHCLQSHRNILIHAPHLTISVPGFILLLVVAKMYILISPKGNKPFSLMTDSCPVIDSNTFFSPNE